MIETIAKQLREWIAKRFSAADPAVALDGYGAGDLYTGNVSVDSLRYTRGDLVIDFEMAVHHESGQIDQWTVTITGADPGDRDALIEVFHPRVRAQHYLHIRDSTPPTFSFNGHQVGFPEPI